MTDPDYADVPVPLANIPAKVESLMQRPENELELKTELMHFKQEGTLCNSQWQASEIRRPVSITRQQHFIYR